MHENDPPTEAGETRVGGLGAEYAPTGLNDVRLQALALSERWPMSEASKTAVLRRLNAVVQNPETKLRALLAASKVLASLSRLNLSAVDTALRAKTVEELEDRLKALEQRIAPDTKGATR